MRREQRDAEGAEGTVDFMTGTVLGSLCVLINHKALAIPFSDGQIRKLRHTGI